MSTVTRHRPPAPRSAGSPPRRAAPASSARSIDPFRVLRRHVVLLVCTGVFGGALGGATYFSLNKFVPRYSGEVLFEIRAGLSEARDVGSHDIAQDDLVMRLASTETHLLTSLEVIEAAVKQPDVKTTVWFRENFVDAQGTALIDDAVDDLEEGIKRRLIAGTNLFGLKWSAGSAGDVPIVLNSIARAYTNKRRVLDDEIYNENLDLFRTELNQITRELDDLAQEIESFIREKGITTLDDPRSNQLALAMNDLVRRIAEARAELNMSVSGYMQTAAKLEGTVEPTEEDRRMAESHPAARPHEIAVLQAKTVLRELRERYADQKHYSIRKGESRLRALEYEYAAKIEDIMTDNLRGQLNALGAANERIRSMTDQLETEYEEKDSLLRTLAADMSRYLEMEDQRDHLVATRDADIELIREVRLMRLRADASRVRLAQQARTPREKSFPKIEFIVPLVTIAVVGLVTGIIFLRELTDQRIKSASDLAMLPDSHVLGVIPDLDEVPGQVTTAELVVRRDPTSVLAESYRQVMAPTDKAINRAGHQTMLLLGGLPGAGTTTVATNLAGAAAAAGKRVVLVDANFRRPRMAAAMGLDDDDGPGLGDLLNEEVSLDDVLHETEHGISVIAAGQPANRVFERLNNGQFDSVIAQLRERFDLVMVDAPPAVVAGDAMVLANKLDAAVLVVRAFQEQRGLVARLVHQLSDSHCELLGIILNRPRGTAGGYFKKNYSTMAKYSANAPAK